MEHRIPDALQNPVFRYKIQGIKKSAHTFHKEGSQQDPPYDAHCSPQRRKIVRILNQFAVIQTVKDQINHHHTCHDPKPAELDQEQNNDFSEQAPVLRGRNSYKSGHTHGRSRRKQRVDKIGRLVISG